MSPTSLKSALVLCAALFGPIGTASAMGLTFEWGPTTSCFDPKSPPIKLSDVPKGTKELRFSMVDLDAPDFKHGGETKSYAGKASLPYGSFHYKGPCPPSPHTYEISIAALGSGGKVLAEAKARKRFP